MLYEIESVGYLLGQVGIAVGLALLARRQAGVYSWLAATAAAVAAGSQVLLSASLLDAPIGLGLSDRMVELLGLCIGLGSFAAGIGVAAHALAWPAGTPPSPASRTVVRD